MLPVIARLVLSSVRLRPPVHRPPYVTPRHLPPSTYPSAPRRHVKNAQGEPVQIRVGIHTGPVVGGVLGRKTPRFSVYGDTVNVRGGCRGQGAGLVGRTARIRADTGAASLLDV